VKPIKRYSLFFIEVVNLLRYNILTKNDLIKGFWRQGNLVELLAPAGSKEALIAAVESGANAIYLAGNMFGARAYASNFDEEGLKWAVNFAHLRNVKIHVTVNTIIDNTELNQIEDFFAVSL